MSSSSAPAKIFIKVESQAEQNEHLKNARKTFKVLQKSAIPATVIDKENLTGRDSILTKGKTKFNKSKSDEIVLPNQDALKRKKVYRSRQTQTHPLKSPPVITSDDLTSSEKPSENYFEILAERRRSALEDTLEENKLLYERIEGLEQELDTSKAMLEEAKSLIEVLTDMLQENEEDQSDIKSDIINPKETCSDEINGDDNINKGASTSGGSTYFDQKSPVKTNGNSSEKHISPTKSSTDSDDD